MSGRGEKIVCGASWCDPISANFLVTEFFNTLNLLMKLRVLRLRCDEDGNIRVGIFPDREEILIRRFGLSFRPQ